MLTALKECQFYCISIDLSIMMFVLNLLFITSEIGFKMFFIINILLLLYLVYHFEMKKSYLNLKLSTEHKISVSL